MQGVAVCRFCGRTIDNAYVFCPWCGLSRINGETAVFSAGEPVLQENGTAEESLYGFDGQAHAFEAETLSNRIHSISRSLNEMEQDLNRFIELSEKV